MIWGDINLGLWHQNLWFWEHWRYQSLVLCICENKTRKTLCSNKGLLTFNVSSILTVLFARLVCYLELFSQFGDFLFYIHVYLILFFVAKPILILVLPYRTVLYTRFIPGLSVLLAILHSTRISDCFIADVSSRSLILLQFQYPCLGSAWAFTELHNATRKLPMTSWYGSQYQIYQIDWLIVQHCCAKFVLSFWFSFFGVWCLIHSMLFFYNILHNRVDYSPLLRELHLRVSREDMRQGTTFCSSRGRINL